ncbi:MAG: hypothetical protein HC874_14215 [Richelia sp. SL_2_1]|nr:hypothetical protein [Richelia sp. SL_2_1]
MANEVESKEGRTEKKRRFALKKGHEKMIYRGDDPITGKGAVNILLKDMSDEQILGWASVDGGKSAAYHLKATFQTSRFASWTTVQDNRHLV